MSNSNMNSSANFFQGNNSLTNQNELMMQQEYYQNTINQQHRSPHLNYSSPAFKKMRTKDFV